MDSPHEENVRCLRSTRAWESFSRQHAEVAVSRPVLDLSPKRKYDREMAKSMSFRNWKADIEDHPLICQSESLSSRKGETKRAASPTDSQKAKLESLRAAVKNDLRRAIMKRAHSPDSAGGHVNALIKKKDINSCFAASQKLLSLGDNDDHSLDVPPSMTSRYSVDDEDVAFSWDKDDDSLLLSDDDKALLDDLEWDDLEDDEITTSDVQDLTGKLRNTWSMQPLEHSSNGDPDKPQLLSLTGIPLDIYDDEPSKFSCFDKKRASFVTKRIYVPSPRCSSETDDEEELSLQQRFGNGFLQASKKVLSSVWTWAVAVVVLAGVKTLTSFSDNAEAEVPSTPNKYWVESEKLEFDWDDDVEFKFHGSTHK